MTALADKAHRWIIIIQALMLAVIAVGFPNPQWFVGLLAFVAGMMFLAGLIVMAESP